ncbi:unnamed protein product [Onchocerca flexuosa]|uniref:Ovule protein n=1 Tax=Onchocerca flexuosa TaxID=387005 RepID=A0A183I7Q2_9BILA|nr:unnamed protein product [Onchocerca flexuosa]
MSEPVFSLVLSRITIATTYHIRNRHRKIKKQVAMDAWLETRVLLSEEYKCLGKLCQIQRYFYASESP